MIFRILAVIILLWSALFMPFWLTAILAIAGMIYFNYFAEAVAIFLLSDLLYGAREGKFFGIVIISFLAATIAMVLIEFIKKKLKFYN